MTSALAPFVCGSLTLTIFLASCFKAEEEIDKDSCIEVTHIGSQDLPVGSLRLCIGEKGRSQSDSLFENKWTFFFDVATYRRLQKFVITNIEEGPISGRLGPDSSFAVTWRTKGGKRSYIVPAGKDCAYLKGLLQTATEDKYAEFRRVGEDMWAREGCRRRGSVLPK